MPFFTKNRYVETNFTGQDTPETCLNQVVFQDCAFIGCNLRESTLEKCRFERCQFSKCDMSLIKIPATVFKGVHFKECRLMGINWSDANWETGSLLDIKRVDFEHCLLDHSLFIDLDLSQTHFMNCRAHHLDFEHANLTRADFSGADLLDSRFENCDLTETNFAHAINYGINASKNTLHRTRFSMPEAISLLYGLDIILEE